MHSPRPSHEESARAPRAPARTCVGCGKEAAAPQLVRLVNAGDGSVVVDASGGAFGRGAHVHPTPTCLAKAERGLSRSFKCAIRAPQAELQAAIVAALARRAEGLLATAHRLHRLEVGADAVKALLQTGATPLVVVACDAGSVAQSHEVAALVAKGRVVAWSSRAQLGAALGRSEVALFALKDDRLATAFADAIHTMSVLSPSVPLVRVPEEPSPALAPSARAHLPGESPQQWKGEACKSPEVR